MFVPTFRYKGSYTFAAKSVGNTFGFLLQPPSSSNPRDWSLLYSKSLLLEKVSKAGIIYTNI